MLQHLVPAIILVDIHTIEQDTTGQAIIEMVRLRQLIWALLVYDDLLYLLTLNQHLNR